MDNQLRRTAFAKRLNAALHRGGKAELSNDELSRLLARHGVVVTGQTVSNWRNARHMPKLEQIEGVARLLGVDPGELAFGKPRTAEPRALYGSDGADRSVLDAIALLGEQEREALQTLIRLLGPRAPRSGRRKSSAKA